jgi:hypothetical protein
MGGSRDSGFLTATGLKNQSLNQIREEENSSSLDISHRVSAQCKCSFLQISGEDSSVSHGTPLANKGKRVNESGSKNSGNQI